MNIKWISFNDRKPRIGQYIIVYECGYGAYATEYERDDEADFSNSFWIGSFPKCNKKLIKN